MGRNAEISNAIARAEAGLMSARKILRGTRASEAEPVLGAAISDIKEVLKLLDQDEDPSEAKPADLYAVNWTESEAGWGTRPDGHTLHLTERAAVEHIRAYCAAQPEVTPSEYSRPGAPFRVPVTQARYDEVAASPKSWIWGHHTQQINPDQVG